MLDEAEVFRLEGVVGKKKKNGPFRFVTRQNQTLARIARMVHMIYAASCTDDQHYTRPKTNVALNSSLYKNLSVRPDILAETMRVLLEQLTIIMKRS